MDQMAIGDFIAQRRREKNWTQEQLAERIGVSNKTVSKWECGKCMPDYSVVENLCRELDVTLNELINGKASERNLQPVNNDVLLKALERAQNLKRKKMRIIGCILLAMGIAALGLSRLCGGTEVQTVLSGAMLGIAVPALLLGAALICFSFAKR